MYNVLFGLASSPANKEPEIKLSLQMTALTYTTAQLPAMENGKWVSAEPGIRLDLSLLRREKVDGLWNEKS